MSVIPATTTPPLDAVHGTYPGDLSALACRIVGPNLFDELLVVATADYDPARHITRCTFTYLTQHDATAEHAVPITFVDLVGHFGDSIGLAQPGLGSRD
jgi:hypothetical protein